jgi:NSS family neurotransmitter:Na+ symporter
LVESDFRHATWSSRSAFLLATVGAAVGLGNLWRFPYIAGENGGGGFVLVYIGFVLLLGLPLVAGEMLLGRRGHGSAIATMAKLVRSEDASPFWRIIGWLSLVVPIVGLSYYAVVAAWTLDYLGLSLQNAFRGLDAASTQAVFGERIAQPVRQALLHGLFMAMTVFVIAKGVNSGIERIARFMMPALFGILVLLVLYGMAEGNFGEAVTFLFRPDFSELTGRSVLLALGQALFSLAIGVGVLITYSAYMPPGFSLQRSAFVVCLGDTLVALLAGLAIFPIVFGHGLNPAEGPSLIFITLPVAFGNMPGGAIIGSLFFLLLFFAAYTTALGMLEPMISWLSERTRGKRVIPTVLTGFATWLLGLGSVFSFSILADFRPFAFLGVDRNFFDVLDFGIANILLPVNALLIAIFTGWILHRRTAAEEFQPATSAWMMFWRFSVRYVAPIAITLVLVDLLLG